MRQSGGEPSLGARSSMTQPGENKEDTMTRLLTIVATVVVALAVMAAPASAYGKMHYEDITMGTSTDAPTWPFETQRPWWWPS